jgi:hypothetical protein
MRRKRKPWCNLCSSYASKTYHDAGLDFAAFMKLLMVSSDGI